MSDDIKFYKNNPGIKSANQKIAFTEEQVQEYLKCADDPVYFIENYVKIVSIENGPVLFKMFPYQKRIIEAIHNNTRVIVRIGRQLGKCVSFFTQIYIKNKETNETNEIYIGDFYNLCENLANENDICNDFAEKFTDSINLSDWEVLTDTGYHDVSFIHKTVPYQVWRIVLQNGLELECADDHIVFDENMNEIFVKDLTPCYSRIMTQDGPVLVTQVMKYDEYQEMYDLSVESDDHRFYSNGILSHNSTTFAAFTVWYTMFNEYKSVAILANKMDIAKEIFSRVQFAIENLPLWLQQGIVEWNKTSFVLENGSECFAAATSPSAIRGRSCVVGSTHVYYVDEDDNVFYTTINNIIHNTIPKQHFIGKGDIAKQEAKLDLLVSNCIDIPIRGKKQLLTQNGFRSFDGFINNGVQKTLSITTINTSLTCTFDHRLLLQNGNYVDAETLSIGDVLYPNEVIEKIEESNDESIVYDAMNVQDTHSYFTNRLVSHNCNVVLMDEFAHLKPNLAEEFIKSVFPTISSSNQSKMAIVSTPNGLNHFYKIWNDSEQGRNQFIRVEGNWKENPNRTQEWADQQKKELGEVGFQQEVECSFIGSSYTLIDGHKLAVLPYINPIFENNKLEIFKKPEKNNSYIITVDTSRGRGLDYSAFSVIDVTQTPYEVVACYKDNEISTMEYPHLIYNMARQYNDAYLLIEVNDIGGEIANILWYDYEYENLYFTNSKSDITTTKGYPGVRTTTKVKTLGCSVLKDLIEKDQLILNSYRFIEELGVFTLQKKSYGADDPIINDDLTATLWLFAWLTKQEQFQEATNVNIRQILSQQKSEYIDSQMTPFGFVVTGLEDLDQVNDSSKLPTSGSFNLTDSQLSLLG